MVADVVQPRKKVKLVAMRQDPVDEFQSKRVARVTWRLVRKSLGKAALVGEKWYLVRAVDEPVMYDARAAKWRQK